MTQQNLMPEPPPTLLPDDPAALKLGEGTELEQVARAHPESSLVWALLAEQALADERDIEGYAYARTGYHRGLDALRRNGWKGHGPIPWSHEPNRGFLRALAQLAVAAGRIGEEPEVRRCRELLRDSSAEAADALGL